MTWTEILGFVTGAATVLLAVRESAWNWPVGIANNVFFLILFWKQALGSPNFGTSGRAAHCTNSVPALPNFGNPLYLQPVVN